MWDKRSRLVTVHDGDTVTMTLDQGFGATQTIKVRLLGVWAPELKDPGGKETKAFVDEWFNKFAGNTLSTWPWLVVTARTADHEAQTFDRYVCTVSTLDGTQSLNTAVMDFIQRNGYGGGTGAK